MLPLEAPLRLIGGTTDFKLYYSLYVNNVYICIIIVLSLGNSLSIKKFLFLFADWLQHEIHNIFYICNSYIDIYRSCKISKISQ